jgi:ABC-type bacteriocin/lantibiotic exporter with double-glycine peptidase domain
MPRLLIEAFTVTGVLLMLLIMILFGTDLVSIIPQLSAFVVAAIRLLPSISRISNAMNQVPFLEGGLDNVIHTLQVEKEEETLPEQKTETKSANQSITFTKELTLSHIDFHYPNTDKNVLSDAEMEIRPGQSVGIVGASGAGKTTAVDIMLGLLYPQQGQVLVDGVDISAGLHSAEHFSNG